MEDENGKPLADLGLLPKPARLAIVLWLLVFFIKGASSSRCSAALLHGHSRCARSRRQYLWLDFSMAHPLGNMRMWLVLFARCRCRRLPLPFSQGLSSAIVNSSAIS